jgi:SAM-dependent methyltransferase
MMDVYGKQTLEVMGTARWYNEWLFDKIKKHLKGEILEIGVGTGNFSLLLSQKGNVTAIDYNEDYIKDIKKLESSKVRIGHGDIEKGEYFFINKKFDSIVSFNVYEHIKKDKVALDNTFKLLKKGGVLISIVPAHKLLFSKFDINLGHYRRYSISSMKNKLQNAGLKVLEINYLNWWAAVGWLTWFKLLGYQNMPKGPVSIFDKVGRIFLMPEKHIKPPFGLSVLAISQKV